MAISAPWQYFPQAKLLAMHRWQPPPVLRGLAAHETISTLTWLSVSIPDSQHTISTSPSSTCLAMHWRHPPRAPGLTPQSICNRRAIESCQPLSPFQLMNSAASSHLRHCFLIRIPCVWAAHAFEAIEGTQGLTG
eukprot:scaffold1102_cov21-Tisochrysis_lutea.AAC.2